jgi:hypothetical protein
MSLLATSQLDRQDVIIETLGVPSEYRAEVEPAGDGRSDPTFGGRLLIPVKFRLTASY